MLLLVTVSVPSRPVLKPQLIPKSQKSYKITDQQNESDSPSTKNWFAQLRLLLLLLLSAPVLFHHATCQLPRLVLKASCWHNLDHRMLVEFRFAVHQLFFNPSIFCRKLVARHNIPCDDVTKFKLTVPAQPIKASKVFQCSMFAGLWSV